MISMKKSIFTSLLLILTFINCSYSQIPPLDWAKNTELVAVNMATDINSNVYIIGTYTGTVNVNFSGSGQVLNSMGGRDIAIVKYDKNGVFKWANSYGSPANDEVTSISITDSGDVYVGGYFSSNLDFDPNNSSTSSTLTTSSTNTESFITKLDTNGNYIWAKAFSGSSNTDNLLFSMATNDLGDLYVFGYMQGPGIVDFDPSTSASNVSGSVGISVYKSYIVKLNSAGNFVWVKNFVTANNMNFSFNGNRITTAAIDSVGNIYAGGLFTAQQTLILVLGLLHYLG